MKKTIIICLSFILVLSSCASTMDVIRYSFSGPPTWVEDPTFSISSNSKTYIGGPSKTIQEARNQAYSGLASYVILDIKSKENFSNSVSANENERTIDSSYDTNQQTNSAVTLVGVSEINRWRHPVTGEYYIRYEISKDDYEESKIATEKKFQELTTVDMKLKSAILNLVNNPSKSFITQLNNSKDLYISVINREWDTPLYIEPSNHLTHGDTYLANYISGLISSLNIELVTDDLVCEDTQSKTLEFQVRCDLYSDLSNIKFILTNLNNDKTYRSVTNSSGQLFFTIPSTDLELGTLVLDCTVYGLDIDTKIENIIYPNSKLDLDVIHTPPVPSSIYLNLSNPPWSSVNLTWNPVESATSYKIYRSTFKSDNILEVGETTDTFFIDKNLEPNTKYLYKIAAVHYSGTASLLSKANLIQTTEKPVLDLNVSKTKAYGDDSVVFTWTSSKSFYPNDVILRIELTKDNKVVYFIDNIPNLGSYEWIVPSDVEEGTYSVSITDNISNLTNRKNKIIRLSGAHEHDGNNKKTIGSLSSKQKYTSSGSVCSYEVVDQFELKVNAFFFHSFNVFVKPTSKQTDLQIKIIDLDTGKTKEIINDNGFGISESRDVGLSGGNYLINVMYLSGAGSEYTFTCKRL